MTKAEITGLIMLVLIPLAGFTQYDVTVKPGSAMTVNNSTYLNIRNGGDLLLQDDYDHAPSFLANGTVSITGGGMANVEQYITRDAWHMVSSPTGNEQISAYMWMYLYTFHEPDNTWYLLYQPVTLPLTAGTGYFLYSFLNPPGGYPPADDYAILKGTLNDQSINIALSNTDASTKSGWNLIGNPYPCALHWNGHADWNLNNAGASMYVVEPTTGNYVFWNYNTGGTNANGGYIAATQGFWIRAADTTGLAASITIPQSQRCHNNTEFYKSTGSFLPDQLLLALEASNGYDKTIVGFIENAHSDFDAEYDAMYIPGTGEAPSLFSTFDYVKYAMNHFPSYTDYSEIPLGIKYSYPGLMSIKAEWIESFSPDVPIYLEDKVEKNWINLRESPIYSYTADLNDPENRFSLHFKNPLGITAPQILNEIRIYGWEQSIYVEIPFAMEGTIQIYNMFGQKVSDAKAFQGTNQVPVDHGRLQYLVRVLSDQGIKIKKVYIN